MKLIIDIPEELIESFNNAKKENAFNYFRVYNNTFYNAIKNGIPLEEELKTIKEDMKDTFYDYKYNRYDVSMEGVLDVLDKRIEEDKQ